MSPACAESGLATTMTEAMLPQGSVSGETLVVPDEPDYADDAPIDDRVVLGVDGEDCGEECACDLEEARQELERNFAAFPAHFEAVQASMRSEQKPAQQAK